MSALISQLTSRLVVPRIHFSIFSIGLLLLTTLQAQASPQKSDEYTPEHSTTTSDYPELSGHTKRGLADSFIAVTAHPLATEAAYNILKEGGNVVDAMVVVQTILGLVEPQSSGLGGGAFALYYDSTKNQLKTFDGRETAPLKATSELFFNNDNNPMGFYDAVLGGRSVGTPGTVKLLWEMHQQFGSKKWFDLLQPAIKLANKGFVVSARLAESIAADKGRLEHDPEASNYFFPEGEPIQEGSLLKNMAYANTLTLMAKKGGDFFYETEFANSIVDKVNNSDNPGSLSPEDFSRYQIIERMPECIEYRQFDICGMGPPSSGAITVNQILGMLSTFDMTKHSPDQATTWQIIAEASRLAFADRGQYIADPSFYEVPNGLTNTNYLSLRSKLIQPGKANKEVSFGIPPGVKNKISSPGNSPELASTTHFVLVDKQGNIISMTSTIENAFGSRLMVNGFLLNNELTDFSFTPEKNGQLVANRVEPGKRPRSSMAPTLVFKKHKDGSKTPYLALGSPGGSRIINFVANSLIQILDWNKDIKEAFDAPHILNRFGTMELETETMPEEWLQQFKSMGYKATEQDINSGLHGVFFHNAKLIGAADERREGTVKGL